MTGCVATLKIDRGPHPNLFANKIFDFFSQVTDMERFSQKTVSPGADGNHPAVGIIQRGDDDDGRGSEIYVGTQHPA